MTTDNKKLSNAAETAIDLALTLLKGPLSILPIPRWAAALGAGTLATAAVEFRPRLKSRLKELEGKLFCFEAVDLDAGFNLLIKDGGVTAVPNPGRAPDVTMRGTSGVLTELALGAVDPDTVFFSRRLEISGDTASAILLKNILADA